jgi:hypothetical protein
VNFGGLVSAATLRFHDMGDPGTTEIYLAQNGEYRLRDRRWGLWMHTFSFKGQMDPDVLYPQFCRRIAFLRDKLLSDFDSGEKVFVFKSTSLDKDDLLMLHRVLRSLGPVKLLHVRLASDQRDGFSKGEPGQTFRIAPDLFVGYLRRAGPRPDGSWDIAFDDWVEVCRRVSDACHSTA